MGMRGKLRRAVYRFKQYEPCICGKLRQDAAKCGKLEDCRRLCPTGTFLLLECPGAHTHTYKPYMWLYKTLLSPVSPLMSPVSSLMSPVSPTKPLGFPSGLTGLISGLTGLIIGLTGLSRGLIKPHVRLIRMRMCAWTSE